MQAVPAIVQMKAMIDAGWIGEVFGADVAFEVPLFSAAQTNVPGYVWFADPANCAGAGPKLGRHMLHLPANSLAHVAPCHADPSRALQHVHRSEGRRVGQEGASRVRLRWGA